MKSPSQRLVSDTTVLPPEPELQPEPFLLRKRVLSWRTIVPLVVVIVGLVVAAQHLSLELNLPHIGAALMQANLWLVLAGLFAFYASLLLRGVRWKLLLEQVGYGPESGVRLPRLLSLTKILYLSWFANVIVPAKLGDFYRAYLLRQEAKVSITRSFGTVFAERIMDLIALPLFFLLALLVSLHGQLPSQVELALEICFALMLVLIIGLGALRFLRQPIERLIPVRLRPQYEQFQAGTLGSFKRLHLLAPLTASIWMVEALRFLLIALATGLLNGDPLHVTSAAFLIALGESLLTTVPLTSGGVGFVEAGMFALIWLFVPHTGAAQNLAGATIVLDRVVSLGSILVFGGLLFFVEMLLSKHTQASST